MTTMFSFLKVMVVLDTHWKSSYDWYRFRYGGFLGFFEWVGTGLEGRDLDQREGTSGVRKGGVITAKTGPSRFALGMNGPRKYLPLKTDFDQSNCGPSAN